MSNMVAKAKFGHEKMALATRRLLHFVCLFFSSRDWDDIWQFWIPMENGLCRNPQLHLEYSIVKDSNADLTVEN